MERQYAATISAGDAVDAHFVLRSKDVRQARTGDAYLSLDLTDPSGRIAGVMFRPSLDARAVPVGTVVRVRGSAASYRGSLRIKVDSLRIAADHDPRTFLPTGLRDPKETLADLRALVRSVGHPGLGRVLRRVFGDVAFMRAFKSSPASAAGHHAYLGGLLEHTVAVAAACRHAADVYPEIDADLLVTAALLHDAGVVDSLDRDGAFVHTDEGRLVGHAVLGERRVGEALASAGQSVSSDLAVRLRHAVLAHHGAPVPRTLEAVVLAHADTTDADIAVFAAAIAVVGRTEERWTDAANPLGRALLSPREDVPAVADGAPALSRSA